MRSRVAHRGAIGSSPMGWATVQAQWRARLFLRCRVPSGLLQFPLQHSPLSLGVAVVAPSVRAMMATARPWLIIFRRQVGRGRALRLADGAPRRARPRLAELPCPAAQLRLMDAQFRRNIHDRQSARLHALRGLSLDLIREIPALLLLHWTRLPLARKPIMGFHSIGAGSDTYSRMLGCANARAQAASGPGFPPPRRTLEDLHDSCGSHAMISRSAAPGRRGL